MTVGVVVLIVGVGAAIIVAVAWASFRLGASTRAEPGFDEVIWVRLRAAEAARRMHDLTREAFISMAEWADRHGPRQP